MNGLTLRSPAFLASASGAPPVNTVAPAVSVSSATPGTSVSVTTGTWIGAVTYAYQWYLAAVAAQEEIYTVTVGACAPDDYIGLDAGGNVALTHSFWLYDNVGMTGAPPAWGGTHTQVSIDDMGDANQIATRLALEIDQSGDFAAEAFGNTVVITCTPDAARFDGTATGGLSLVIDQQGVTAAAESAIGGQTTNTCDTTGLAVNDGIFSRVTATNAAGSTAADSDICTMI